MEAYSILLRVEFTVPSAVASDAVRSYRTFSPLPELPQAVCFLLHWSWTCIPQTLSGTLSCEARTFLSCIRLSKTRDTAAVARLTGSEYSISPAAAKA